jgi:hypothetical protein
MKKIFATVLILLLQHNIFAQKNEVNLFFSDAISGRIEDYSSVGLGYYHALHSRIKIGCALELPLATNLYKYSQSQGDQTKTLFFTHTDTIKVSTFDLLLKGTIAQSSFANLSLIAGTSYQHYRFTHIPLLEIKDNTVINQKEATLSKGFFLPKIGISTNVKIYKSLSATGCFVYRTTALLKSNNLYVNYQKNYTTDQTSSGSGYSTIDIHDQIGGNLGLTFSF